MQCSSNDSDFGSMAIVHTSPECSTIGNGKSMENPPLIDDVALKTLHVLREFKGICPLPPSTQLPKDPLTATGRAAPRNLSEFAGGSKERPLVVEQKWGLFHSKTGQEATKIFRFHFPDVRKGFSMTWICYIREFKDSMNQKRKRPILSLAASGWKFTKNRNRNVD